MQIKHEKTAATAAMFDPKCYALYNYEDLKWIDGKVKVSGLQIKKSDNCDFVQKVGEHMLNMILRKNDVQGALQFLNDKLNELVEEKLNPNMLALYKKLSKKDYKGNAVAHAELAKRINLRKPGFGPKSGESVKYLYIDVGDWDNKKKAVEKIEDFDYVIENKLPIDYVWYIDNHIKHPFEKFLQHLISKDDIDKYF